MRWIKHLLFNFLCCLSLVAIAAWSCSSNPLSTKDNSFMQGRTIQFGIPLDLGTVSKPSNNELQKSLPDSETNVNYRAQYAAFKSFKILDQFDATIKNI